MIKKSNILSNRLALMVAASLTLAACSSDDGATLVDENGTSTEVADGDSTGEVGPDNPDTDDLDTDTPDTDNPDTDTPDTDNPDTDNPDTDTPDTDTPDTDNPDTDNPDTGDDTSSEFNPNLQTASVVLDTTSTVPPANAPGASGDGAFSVDTQTGVVAGSVTVAGTTGQPMAAHIHSGAPGDAGPILITLIGNDDGTVWSTPADATLDASGIALFEAGELYVNVHTEENPAGELRSQLTDASVPTPNSITVTLTNTSEFQPMTPPVVMLHNAPNIETGIRIFEVGQPAINEIVQVAEDGIFQPLLDLAELQTRAGLITATAVGFSDPENPGPLLPGETATVNLELELDNQVMTVVSMVVCTNDAFTGVDSHVLSDQQSETFTAAIYDAGSETNVLTLDYWVPPCSLNGLSDNIGDNENGAIVEHPGQSGSENPDFDFPAGSEFLEVTIDRN